MVNFFKLWWTNVPDSGWPLCQRNSWGCHAYLMKLSWQNNKWLMIWFFVHKRNSVLPTPVFQEPCNKIYVSQHLSPPCLSKPIVVPWQKINASPAHKIFSHSFILWHSDLYLIQELLPFSCKMSSHQYNLVLLSERLRSLKTKPTNQPSQMLSELHFLKCPEFR